MSRAIRAMTCIELVVFMVLIAFVAYGAVRVGVLISDEWWGAVVGAVVGFGAFFLSGLIVVYLFDRIFGFGCPPCDEGSCRAGDYELVPGSEENGDYRLRCKHGFLYRRRGRRFVRLDEEGRESGYYIWRAFRGWRREEVRR